MRQAVLPNKLEPPEPAPIRELSGLAPGVLGGALLTSSEPVAYCISETVIIQQRFVA